MLDDSGVWHRFRPSLCTIIRKHLEANRGEMAEWLKAHAWKACLLERVTWVRIPLSPPVLDPHKQRVFLFGKKTCRMAVTYHAKCLTVTLESGRTPGIEKERMTVQQPDYNLRNGD
jgi:hypothetical protein